MSQNRNSISKQILAWAAVFALVLNIIPYSAADQSSNEYFESWSYQLGDTDGDNQNDIIFFTFDPDTNVTDYVNIYVEMRVTDNNGNWVGNDDEHYEIYWTENDTFEMEWFVNDCDDFESDCEGPFDFQFRLYEEVQDEVYYYEDNFTESNISLYETTIIPEGVIQVDNGVIAADSDGLNNDIVFNAIMQDYDVENVTIDLERKVGTQWVDAGETVTNDEGEAEFKNRTSGEYRWFAEYDNESIDEGHTFVFYSPTSNKNLGHMGVVDDMDDDDDFDEFAFARWSNGSEESINDGIYVEIYYEENNTLYDSDGGDGDGWFLLFTDVEQGNYTFKMYNESSSGDLMQTGWLHSYGSFTDHHDIWFEDWNYTTDDENNNGIADVITVEYNPDTSCNCTLEVEVILQISNESGAYVDGDSYDHEINGTNEEWFETDPWAPNDEGNYTFELFLIFEDGSMVQDNFSFSAYLECNYEYSDNCYYNLWFNSSSFVTEDNDDNGVDDTIVITYDPDTDCNCETNVTVFMSVIDDNNSYIFTDYFYHEINGTNDESFETDPWSPYQDGNYTFNFTLYGNNWDWQDNFSFTTYLECNVESNFSYCTYDSWFEDWTYSKDDNDDDGVEDTIVIKYNPDTECNCEINVSVQMNVYDENYNFVHHDYFYHLINGTEDEGFETNDWSPYKDGNYTFTFALYDNNWYFQDNFSFTTYLDCDNENETTFCNSDEWFASWSSETTSTDQDNLDDTIIISYDPDTDCDCDVRVFIDIDVYYNDSSQWAGELWNSYVISGTDEDDFHMNWTSHNSTSYDFHIVMHDQNWTFEDSFTISDIYLHQKTGAGGIGDEDEWYDNVWNYTYDEDDDGFNDTFELAFNPDTTCDCTINVTSVLTVIDSSNNSEVAKISLKSDIYSDNYDWFDISWTAEYNGTFDFYLDLYDEDDNLEDSAYRHNIELYARSIHEHEETEWFEDSWFKTEGNLFEANYFPATNCDCWVKIWIYIDVYYDGDKVDTISEEMYIHGDEEKWSSQDWHADQTGDYDFHIVLFNDEGNGPDEVKDHYWVDNIYLEIDDDIDGDDAWFEDLYYSQLDMDDDTHEDSVSVHYVVSGDCDCELTLLLILDIFDENNEMIDTFEENFTIYGNENKDISFTWSNDHMEGNITFMSFLEYLVDGDKDGEIIVQERDNVTFYLATYRGDSDFHIEDVNGRDNVVEGQYFDFEIIFSDKNAVDDLQWSMGDGQTYYNDKSVLHRYNDSGQYTMKISYLYNGNMYFEEFDIFVANLPPRILNVMLDDIINEGDEVSFNIQYEDVPMDEVSVSWSFPDEVLIGDFVQYTFVDNGEYFVVVSVKDKDGGISTEQKMITVQNVAPKFTEFNMPSEGEQGVPMDFSVLATDPGKDEEITYTFNFGDGTAQLITQSGNVSHKFAKGDNFEIVICVFDKDGGETCRTQVIPVALLEQLEESGLPGFGFLGVISAFGVITILRRRTH